MVLLPRDLIAPAARRPPYLRLADAFVAGIFAGDIEQLSMRALSPAVYDGVRASGSFMKAMQGAGALARLKGAGVEGRLFPVGAP